MKKIILSLAAATMALGAFAQSSIIDNPNNSSYFGIRASVDIAAPSSEPDAMYSPGAGFAIGGIYNTPVLANLYFEPGVSLYYDTWGAKENFNINANRYLDVSFRNFGMAIPLQFGYHFDLTPDLNVAVFTGPELKVGFVNKMRYKAGIEAVKVQDYINMYGDKGLFSTIDCAWKFGAAINYDKYYLGVSGAVGLVNLYDEASSNLSFHQNIVQVSLGYNF